MASVGAVAVPATSSASASTTKSCGNGVSAGRNTSCELAPGAVPQGSRDSHGGQARIKAALFPARKTLEEFDFAFQTSVPRNQVLHLGQLDFLAGKENVVLLGPPGTGKTHL